MICQLLKKTTGFNIPKDEISSALCGADHFFVRPVLLYYVTVQHLRLGMLRIPRCGWSEALLRALTTQEI